MKLGAWDPFFVVQDETKKNEVQCQVWHDIGPSMIKGNKRKEEVSVLISLIGNEDMNELLSSDVVK